MDTMIYSSVRSVLISTFLLSKINSHPPSLVLLIFHICFCFIDSVLFSKQTHINHVMQLWDVLTPFLFFFHMKCRDLTAMNRASGGSPPLQAFDRTWV